MLKLFLLLSLLIGASSGVCIYTYLNRVDHQLRMEMHDQDLKTMSSHDNYGSAETYNPQEVVRNADN